jgi:tetratricopeptide (TPR) repeat protein
MVTILGYSGTFDTLSCSPFEPSTGVVGVPRERAVAAGIAVAVAAGVVGGLHYSGGYYALAAGILGALVAIAATALLVLGLAPSRPAVVSAATLAGLGAWAGASTAWGGLPHASWRLAGITLTAAAAVLVGSALAGRAHAVAVGVLAGITLHAAYVIAMVAFGSEPVDWFRIRQLEGPIGYHNGEGVIAAMGFPLAIWVAASANRWLRAAGAAAAVALLSLAFLTQSRGSLAAVALALVIQLAVARRARVAFLALLLALTSVGLFLALRGVDRALIDNRPLDDDAFARYGLVTLALALAAGAVSLVSLPPLRLSRARAYAVAGATLIAAVAIAAVAAAIVAPRLDSLRERLTAEPNQPSKVAAGDTRLSSFSPTGRIELWDVASEMVAEEPLLGYGVGSFTRRWTVDRTSKDAYVLQPHSLQLETLAELGAAGFALLVAAVGGVAWCTVRGIRRDRALGAAVAGALAAFLFISSVDWVYSFAGFVVPAMLLAGAAAGPGPRRVPSGSGVVALVAGLLVTLGLLAGPALAQRQLDRARAQAPVSLDAAARTAASARSWDRWDPDVVAFQALVADAQGRLPDAAALYRRAAELSQQPWTLYYREADVLRRAGRVQASRAACRQAIAANPLEPELQRGVCDDVE